MITKCLKYSLVLCVAFLVACSTQEATDEEYNRGADGTDFGPGIFSGDKGSINLSKKLRKKKEEGSNGDANSSTTTSSSTSYNVNVPSIGEQSFRDFEAFKAWRRAQEPSSENYQEYQDWRAYQRYLRFKEQQPQNKINTSP